MLLWCFDDYLVFTLFTLSMLILMESMQVKQRIQNMESLRAMRTESFPVLVYRNVSAHSTPHSLEDMAVCAEQPARSRRHHQRERAPSFQRVHLRPRRVGVL